MWRMTWRAPVHYANDDVASTGTHWPYGAVRTVMGEWCGEGDVQFPQDHVVYNGLTTRNMAGQSDVAGGALRTTTPP